MPTVLRSSDATIELMNNRTNEKIMDNAKNGRNNGGWSIIVKGAIAGSKLRSVHEFQRKVMPCSPRRLHNPLGVKGSRGKELLSQELRLDHLFVCSGAASSSFIVIASRYH